MGLGASVATTQYPEENLVCMPSVNLDSVRIPQSMPIVEQARSACSRRPVRPLVILYVQKQMNGSFRERGMEVEVDMRKQITEFRS